MDKQILIISTKFYISVEFVVCLRWEILMIREFEKSYSLFGELIRWFQCWLLLVSEVTLLEQLEVILIRNESCNWHGLTLKSINQLSQMRWFHCVTLYGAMNTFHWYLVYRNVYKYIYKLYIALVKSCAKLTKQSKRRRGKNHIDNNRK